MTLSLFEWLTFDFSAPLKVLITVYLFKDLLFLYTSQCCLVVKNVHRVVNFQNDL